MRITVPQIKAQKNTTKITALTCYDYSFAKLLDGKVDVILVGDSLGMVVYGMASTLPVTLSMMINHGAAVVKGTEKSLVVIDMPFGSYQKSPAEAFKNAAKIIAATGCQAVKLEGGSEMAATIAFLVERGIPVMGHIGLQPQSFNAYGGYKVQGKNGQDKFLQSAKDLETAGCFALVIEGVKQELSSQITKAINIPTIGIGAAPDCDGQVLVLYDILGIDEAVPKFVKKYAQLKANVEQAVNDYAADVKSGKFPGKEYLY